MHYVIYAIPDCDLNKLRKAKSAVKNYHNKHVKFGKLRISNLYLSLDDKKQLILIRSFQNKSEALDYTDNHNKLTEVNHDVFAVTQYNYKELVKQRSTKNYEDFYDIHYNY